ncbi:MAG: acyl-CoA dehydratase activase [Dehalococcoidia bacterium]
MIAAGCDIGALTAKAAIMRDGELVGTEIIPVKPDAVRSATEVMGRLLGRLGLSFDDIDYCVSTGYGRRIIPFADTNISEISCHARGAWWLVPSIRTVLDAGGQDCKAIRVGDKGELKDFRMNMKCAAGTGKSLEIMAEALGVGITELGELALQASEPVSLKNQCCILTEITIRRLILEGRTEADVAAGICNHTAKYIAALVQDMGARNDIGFTGGIAKNAGVVTSLEHILKTELVEFPVDPQLIGAIGAALFAAEMGKA